MCVCVVRAADPLSATDFRGQPKEIVGRLSTVACNVLQSSAPQYPRSFVSPSAFVCGLCVYLSSTSSDCVPLELSVPSL